MVTRSKNPRIRAISSPCSRPQPRRLATFGRADCFVLTQRFVLSNARKILYCRMSRWNSSYHSLAMTSSRNTSALTELIMGIASQPFTTDVTYLHDAIARHAQYV
jgi:hypothetical protein